MSDGSTGVVELLDNGAVVKSFYPIFDSKYNIRDISKDNIYRRLGPHRDWLG